MAALLLMLLIQFFTRDYTAVRHVASHQLQKAECQMGSLCVFVFIQFMYVLVNVYVYVFELCIILVMSPL